jgi:hypothetical protein
LQWATPQKQVKEWKNNTVLYNITDLVYNKKKIKCFSNHLSTPFIAQDPIMWVEIMNLLTPAQLKPDSTIPAPPPAPALPAPAPAQLQLQAQFQLHTQCQFLHLRSFSGN